MLRLIARDFVLIFTVRVLFRVFLTGTANSFIRPVINAELLVLK